MTAVRDVQVESHLGVGLFQEFAFYLTAVAGGFAAGVLLRLA